MNTCLSWLSTKFSLYIYGEQRYTYLNSVESRESSNESIYEPEILLNIRIQSQFSESISESELANSSSDSNFKEMESESESEPEQKININSNLDLIINSYRDDPIERIQAPSPN